MSVTPIHPARWDWPSTIGNLILSFGALDYLVFVFLKDHLPPGEFGKVREMHFKDRVLRIAKYLETDGSPTVDQAALAVLLQRLEPFREIRNAIAHGHLLVRFDDSTGEAVVSLSNSRDVDMAYTAEARHVEFDELFFATASMPALIDEFQKLIGFATAATAKIKTSSQEGTVTSFVQPRPTP